MTLEEFAVQHNLQIGFAYFPAYLSNLKKWVWWEHVAYKPESVQFFYTDGYAFAHPTEARVYYASTNNIPDSSMAGVRNVVPPEYLHCPEEPDMSRWPFDTPVIMTELKRRGLTPCSAGSLQPRMIFDAVGIPWMNRALTAEAQGRDAVHATEQMIQYYEKRIEALEARINGTIRTETD